MRLSHLRRFVQYLLAAAHGILLWVMRRHPVALGSAAADRITVCRSAFRTLRAPAALTASRAARAAAGGLMPLVILSLMPAGPRASRAVVIFQQVQNPCFY